MNTPTGFMCPSHPTSSERGVMPDNDQLALQQTTMGHMLLRHTVVVRPWYSYCGNCNGNIIPGPNAACRSCGTTFCFSATNTIGGETLDEVAANLKNTWPTLEFIGVAANRGESDENAPAWELYELWIAPPAAL